MVSSPPAKRKRQTGQQVEGAFEVEEVLGHKLVNHELRFFIKWKGYDQTHNTWEPMDNLVNCTVFRQFINSKFKALETDIYVNICNIKQRLKKKIRNAVMQKKAITMLEIQPFDPFEYRVKQVLFHLLGKEDEVFLKELEDQVFKNHIFKLDQVQRIKNDELLERIRKKEDVKVTIENDEDFEDPPQFHYITKNFLSDEMYVIEHNNERGCECTTCTKDSKCCPKIKGNEPFAYRVNRQDQPVLRLTKADKIIECGDLCSCGSECLNRATQQRKETPMCLFKTVSRGWGVRALEVIPKGKFILEYVGELIGQAEANSRSETAYLFDLNCDRRKDSCFYTIDAFKFGNLSRFVNHSCEPNARIWFVYNCSGNPKDQKLCFFAERIIKAGEEITIDYSGGDCRDPNDARPIPCNCCADSCKKFIY